MFSRTGTRRTCGHDICMSDQMKWMRPYDRVTYG